MPDPSPSAEIALTPAADALEASAESLAAATSARAIGSSAAPPAAGTSLREETALLEIARASLARSDGLHALGALVRYESRFPSGALADEAAVLRVEALRAAGRGSEARQFAERFAGQHPDSTYADRIRALAGQSPPRSVAPLH